MDTNHCITGVYQIWHCVSITVKQIWFAAGLVVKYRWIWTVWDNLSIKIDLFDFSQLWIFYNKQQKYTTILEQLCTRNWHYCAVFIKSVRFGTECKQSISNIFLICHILWHFQDGRRWPWEFYIGQKLKHVPISLKIVSNCSSSHKDSKNV